MPFWIPRTRRSVTTDLSDSGSNPNGTNPGEDGDTGTSDDKTPLLLPDLKVAKQANTVVAALDASGAELTGVFDVTYLVVIENTGTIELTDLQITDDITAVTNFGDAYLAVDISGDRDQLSGLVSGPAIVSDTLANPGDLPMINGGFLGGSGTGPAAQIFAANSGALQVGEQVVVSYTVRIDGNELSNGPDGTTAPVPGNQVLGEADSAAGGVDDLSDDGLDPNTNNGEGDTDNPTLFQAPQVRLWKEHTVAVDNGDGTSTITVTLRVQNSGTVDLTNLSLTEDLQDQFGDAFRSVTVPTLDTTLAPGSTIPADLINAAWVDNTSIDLFDINETGEMLAAGDEFTITFDVVVDPDQRDDDADYLTNTATVSGDGENFDGGTINVDDQSGFDDGSGRDNDEPTVAIIPEIRIAKSAGDAVANGDNWDVTFTLIVENTGSVNLDMLTLTDDIEDEFGNAFVAIKGLAIQTFGSGTTPTVNANWMTDTAMDVLNGDGNLDPGDYFEVVFTVTIDPDGVDSISDPLENQATVGGRAVDQFGNPLTDGAGGQLLAADDSDSGTSPQGDNIGENGDTGTSDDPTPVIIADISATKQVVGTPTQLANGNFEVTYRAVIENIGTVDLASLMLDEDLMDQFGTAYVNAYDLNLTNPPPAGSAVALNTNWNGGGITEIVDTTVSSLLAVGDSFEFEFKVEVDAAAATGVLENTLAASGAAVDATRTPILASDRVTPIRATDDSDSGTDPSNENFGAPGNTGGTDDPTPLLIPDIGLAKEAVNVVANGDNFDVTFTLNWENTGTVDLDSVEILDDIAAQFGGQFLAATIDSVTTSGAATVAVNGAWTGDTAQSLISHTGSPLAVGDTIQVVFTVTIDPDASGTSTSGLENQATSTGTGINPDTGAPDPTLLASDISDNGTDPVGDNGEDENIDGVVGNDPTPVVIVDPEISVAKAVSGTPALLANGNYEVVYSLVIENTGNVDLAGLTLQEDLASQFGSAFVSAGNVSLVTSPSASSSVVLDSLWDGDGATEMISQTASTLLVVGDSFVVEFTVEVDPDAAAAPGALDNQVAVGGNAVDENGVEFTDSKGTAITTTDDSDSGTDPNNTNPNDSSDQGTSDDPTQLLIPSIGLAKSAGDAVPNGDNFDVTFTFVYENNGTVDLTTLTLTDDVQAEFGNAFVGVVAGSLNISGTVATLPGVNVGFEADTTENLLDGTGRLDIGESFEVSFTVTIDPDGIDGVSQGLENQATATGEGINPITDAVDPTLVASDDSDNGIDPGAENGEDDGDGTFGNDPTAIQIADLGIAKSIVGEPELLFSGNYVATYQLVVANTGTLDLASLSLLEDLSTQFDGAFVNAGNLQLTVVPTDSNSSIALNSAGFNGSSDVELVDTAAENLLAVGDSFTLVFTVEINPDQVDGSLDNQIVATGTAVDVNGNEILDSTGTPLSASDLSDSGTSVSGTNPGQPGDEGTSDDPVEFTPAPRPLGVILGTVFLDNNNDGFQQTGEIGLAGVEVTLIGEDVFGNSINRTVLTEASGAYAFRGLTAGDYRVVQTQPEGFDDGIDIGGAGATVGNDQFSGIRLGFGQVFSGNTFAELPRSSISPSTTSGSPARLPQLAPIFRSPVPTLLSNFLDGPGPIYGGIPISSNADPLTLDSGLPVAGGYVADGSVSDCGYPEPVEEVDEPLDWADQPVVETVDEGGEGGCGEEVVVSPEPEVVEQGGESEPPIPREETDSGSDGRGFNRPTFLKRFGHWPNR